MYQNFQTDELNLYFQRLRPILRELFGMAHAICGNYEMAEYVLQRAILENYQRAGRHRSRVGFHENLRRTVRRLSCQEAVKLSNVGAEMTWDGFSEDKIDGAGDDFLLHAAAQEEVDVRRMLMLRHGCGLRIAQIARILDVPPRQVSASLDRFERRLRRRLPQKHGTRLDSLLQKAAYRQLTLPTQPMPEPGVVYRSFEAEASRGNSPRKLFQRATAIAVIVALAVLCAVIFWLAAVLIQPSVADASVLGSTRAEITAADTSAAAC